MTPLALEMLIWFGGRRGDFPNLDMQPQQEILARFIADGVVEAVHAGEPFRHTARGAAWLAMILETPLPVQQWIDPRATYQHVKVGAGDFSEADIARMRMAAASNVFVETAPAFDLPAGFTAWAGAVTDPPDGLDSGDELNVIYRSGKTARLFATQVAWKWNHKTAKTKAFDVMGYRKIENPDDLIRGPGLQEQS